MTAILIADNNADWLKSLTGIVQDGGFSIISASTRRGAEAVLSKREADVAVLDLRLEDDTDDYDISGIEIAEKSDRMVPKIIVSEFGSVTDAAQSLKIDIDGYPQIVDFVKKTDISTDLIRSIERAIKIKDAWHATAQVRLLNQLRTDYDDAREEAKVHYKVSLILSVAFAVPILVGAVLLHSTHGSLSVLFAVMGVLVAEFTNYLFNKKLDFLFARADRFHAERLQINRFEELLESSYKIKDEKAREAFKVALFYAGANQWIRSVEAHRPAGSASQKSGSELLTLSAGEVDHVGD
jgi:ActR/RegA family two-component response regulator